jgi:hypothetical protein
MADNSRATKGGQLTRHRHSACAGLRAGVDVRILRPSADRAASRGATSIAPAPASAQLEFQRCGGPFAGWACRIASELKGTLASFNSRASSFFQFVVRHPGGAYGSAPTFTQHSVGDGRRPPPGQVPHRCDTSGVETPYFRRLEADQSCVRGSPPAREPSRMVASAADVIDTGRSNG